ncbi:hypothetical protein [Burkholderia metallica]
MTTDIRYGIPTGSYLITEQIHAKPGMPALGNTIGPSLMQVYRVDIPLYQIGLFPGAAVLAYAIALGIGRRLRNHA